MLEEHAASVERWQNKRDVLIAAEAEMRGALAAVSARGRELQVQEPGRGTAWLRAWESAAEAWGKLAAKDLAPADIAAATARWQGLLARLASDAGAQP